jgi:hypothetical protein
MCCSVAALMYLCVYTMVMGDTRTCLVLHVRMLTQYIHNIAQKTVGAVLSNISLQDYCLGCFKLCYEAPDMFFQSALNAYT